MMRKKRNFMKRLDLYKWTTFRVCWNVEYRGLKVEWCEERMKRLMKVFPSGLDILEKWRLVEFPKGYIIGRHLGSWRDSGMTLENNLLNVGHSRSRTHANNNECRGG